MASPALLRGRTMRHQHEVDEAEELAPRRSGRRSGRRPGKEPVDEDQDYQQPYEEEEEQEEDEEAAAARRASKHSRRSRGTAGTAAAAAGRGIKPDPENSGQPPSSRRQQQQERRGRQPRQQQGEGEERGQAQGVSTGEERAFAQAVQEAKRSAEATVYRGNISQQEVDQLTRMVVRHVIFKNSEKPGIPIPRADVAAVVNAHTAGGSKKHGLAGYIIACAQYRLLSCFGLELVEASKLNINSRSVPGGMESGAKSFLLRSALPPAWRPHALEQNQRQEERQGLLMVVLGVIELSGGKITEDDLWNLLSSVGLKRGVEHPLFGDPAAVLADFCSQRYIGLDRAVGADGEVRTYFIAENGVGAKAEIGEAGIKQFYEAAAAL